MDIWLHEFSISTLDGSGGLHAVSFFLPGERAPGTHGNETTRNNRGTAGNGVFYAVRAKGLCSDYNSQALEKTRVEAGSNTSTVTLRVVGGDEK
jgi:hypothetical protein